VSQQQPSFGLYPSFPTFAQVISLEGLKVYGDMTVECVQVQVRHMVSVLLWMGRGLISAERVSQLLARGSFGGPGTSYCFQKSRLMSGRMTFNEVRGGLMEGSIKLPISQEG
jgi:hypothetical protein